MNHPQITVSTLATRMQRKKNAVLSRDFESKVVGSKRAPVRLSNGRRTTEKTA